MFSSWTGLAAGLVFPLLAVATPSDVRKPVAEPLSIVSGGWIVELETDVSLDVSLNKRGINARTTGHDSFIGTLNSLNIGFSTLQTYNTPELFHGMAIQLEDDVSDSLTILHLLEMPGVISAYPIRRYRALDHASPRRLRDWDESELVAREELEMAAELDAHFAGQNDLLGSIRGLAEDKPSVTERAAKTYPSIPASKFKEDNFAPHIMTAVDVAHKRGILGKGIKVAILDTGVDYKHPALGGCFGDGCKISFGYDLVGNGYSGFNKPVPDPNPYDPCGEHGTHVTGIVGADPNKFNFTGVAPYAELGMFRVFGCAAPNEVQDDVLVKGMEMAYEAGADVISLSLGGANGWTEDSASRFANRLNELGRIVTIAAGNDGAEGLFFTSSPAASIRTWSIGSVETTQLPVLRTAVASTGRKIPYYSLFKFDDEASTLPVYATSTNLDNATDACNAFPKGTNLSNYLVVTHRGTCYIDTKYANLAAAGARYVLLANNGGVPFYDDGLADGLVQAALIPDAAGEYLRRQYKQGHKNITVDFSNADFHPTPDPVGGLIDSFSTWGPTFDGVQQPSVSAPGGNILSTFPRRLKSYGIISGTSMATPATAGAAALYLSAGGSRPSKSVDIRSIFITTGSLLPNSSADNLPIPVVRQGGGMINITRALATKTYVYPSELALNDTTHFKGTQVVTVTNSDAEAQTYVVSHEPVLTALTYDAGDLQYPSLAPQLTENYASVVFSTKALVVPAGANATLTAKFTPPSGNTKRVPVFGGFVVLTSTKETIRVPYQGVAASLYDVPIVDHTAQDEGAVVPLIVTGSNVSTANIQQGPHVYTLEDDDFPTLIYRLLMGSAKVSVDLAHGDIKYKATLGDPYYNDPTTGVPAPKDGTLYSSIPIIGNIPEMSYLYLARSGISSNTDYEFTWSGNVTVNGKSKEAADGKYRFLLRALKLKGNGTIESDYESWLSPIIHVERA